MAGSIGADLAVELGLGAVGLVVQLVNKLVEIGGAGAIAALELLESSLHEAADAATRGKARLRMIEADSDAIVDEEEKKRGGSS